MTATEHGFKAEVQQLLNLMIHSVYSDREVFLRELLSNSADALDKVRFMGLTRSDLVDPRTELGSEGPGVRVTVDSEARTITVDDDGIGMTHEEVVENLGTIAHSGTQAFLKSLAEGADAPQLIGRFGLGFYASFMVADDVVVESRSALPEAEPVLWSSKGEGTFTIETGSRTARGTSITLHLREDAAEFAEAVRVKATVRKHSNFLPWPILVEGEKANAGKALWAEAPSRVTAEEANAFYKSVATDWQDPALRVHVSVDSPIQYTALLFVPGSRPYDLFLPEAAVGPRLYARRVLIDEHASDMLPNWLRFVRGVVDSEDISLNVSREMVQKTPVVRKIRDALVKRLLKELGRFATAPAEEPVEPESTEEPDEEKEDAFPPAPPKTYADVWRAFGILLKEGYYHDRDRWGELLLPLLRFNTLRHDDGEGLRSLAEYKEGMAEGQDTIWFLTAESREGALSSPHLEAFRRKGYDVLLLTDAVDEWVVSVLTEFDDLPIKSVSRGDLNLDDEEDSDDDAEKVDVTELTPWFEEVLGERVSAVRASSRLTDSAVVLVDDEQGMSANLERLLRQANQDVHGGAKRILEVNAKHPLIRNLAKMREQGRTEAARPMVELLYDDALLLEGTVKDAAAMGRRLQDLLERASGAEVRASEDASAG